MILLDNLQRCIDKRSLLCIHNAYNNICKQCYECMGTFREVGIMPRLLLEIVCNFVSIARTYKAPRLIDMICTTAISKSYLEINIYSKVSTDLIAFG